MFPADNVILAMNKDQVIKCDQCCHDNMRLGHIFPQSSGKRNGGIFRQKSYFAYATRFDFKLRTELVNVELHCS